jgi:hypothetical protein
VPWSRWVTPEPEPRRFDTRFFVARSPEGAEAVVDGVELVGFRWAEPAEALRLRGAEGWAIIAPTAFQLRRLAYSETAEAALVAARAVPDAIIHPELADGVVRIPAGVGYPLTEMSFR